MHDLMAKLMPRLRWSRAEIEAEQTRALGDFVGHAIAHSRWHQARLRHIDAGSLSPARLAEIPPMTKHDLMNHWEG
jgi:hypothetical protein